MIKHHQLSIAYYVGKPRQLFPTKLRKSKVLLSRLEFLKCMNKEPFLEIKI